MAEKKHTPGPWEAKKSGDLVWVESPVHTVCFFFRERPTEISMDAEANARLIAAAPAMLEALKELLQWQRLHLCAEAWAVAEIEALPSVKLARAALRSALGADASTEGAE